MCAVLKYMLRCVSSLLKLSTIIKLLTVVLVYENKMFIYKEIIYSSYLVKWKQGIGFLLHW